MTTELAYRLHGEKGKTMTWIDIESGNLITEEQLRKEYEAMRAEQPEEYSYDFDWYVTNCLTVFGGTLEPHK